MVGGDAARWGRPPALDPMAGLIVHVGGPGMGQVVKLCNNLIYAAQMVATAEATALAVRSGVDMAKLLEVLVHSTGDCIAVRTRLPVPGVIAESPASNRWQPGFMTDLMAKDLDLALAYAARARGAHDHHRHGPPGADRRRDGRVRARGLLGAGQSGAALAGCRLTLPGPLLDAGGDPGSRSPRPRRDHHRALRGVLRRRSPPALPLCDGILASTQPLRDLAAGPSRPGTAPTCRSTAPDWPGASSSTTVWWRASSGRPAEGWTGIKHMTRIDLTTP